MKHVNKFSVFIMVLTFCVSLFSLFILPDNFQLRFNLASGFHSAQKWELFVIPISSIIVYLLFIYIKGYYENKGDTLRTRISNYALYILPIIGLVANINFIYEAYGLANKAKETLLITGTTVYIINSILLILIGFALVVLVKKKDINGIGYIVCLFGMIGLILSMLLETKLIATVYFLLIMLLVISVLVYKWKFDRKSKN